MRMVSHGKFRSVMMEIQRAFYIKERDMWSLRVQFYHKKGWTLCYPYRIKVTNSKYEEFFDI